MKNWLILAVVAIISIFLYHNSRIRRRHEALVDLYDEVQIGANEETVLDVSNPVVGTQGIRRRRTEGEHLYLPRFPVGDEWYLRVAFVSNRVVFVGVLSSDIQGERPEGAPPWKPDKHPWNVNQAGVEESDRGSSRW